MEILWKHARGVHLFCLSCRLFYLAPYLPISSHYKISSETKALRVYCTAVVSEWKESPNHSLAAQGALADLPPYCTQTRAFQR